MVKPFLKSKLKLIFSSNVSRYMVFTKEIDNFKNLLKIFQSLALHDGQFLFCRF